MMKSAIKDGTSNKVSTKRVIVFILILLLTAVIIAHVFFNKTIAEYVYGGLVEAVIWSMGFIGSEKFVEAIPTFMSNRRNNRQQPNNQYTDPLGGTPGAPEENMI